VITENSLIEVSGIPVEVVRKNIKNLHLAVYPPNGHVRVAVPTRVNDETIRLAVVSRLGWIRKQQKALEQQERQSQREMVTGESHFVQGKRYRLDVIEHNGPPVVKIRGNKTLELYTRPGTDFLKRGEALQCWYRKLLRKQIPDLLTKWEPVVGVQVTSFGIKKMKTKWGSCNADARRIWINLELAKKPYECLEYILVHEMVHFLERNHNDRFRELMDRFMPLWKSSREELNQAPLAHEDWRY